MRATLIAVLIAGTYGASPFAYSAEGLRWTGSASLGIRYTNENTGDASKLEEYRDLGTTAPLTALDVQGRGDDYYLNFFGENFGRDDMFLDLRGGKYGFLKYQIYDNELRHNFGFGPGARSPFAGIGSANLTATLPNLNPNTWNTFDHSYDRRDTGAMFEISAGSPFYFRAEANQVKRSGVNVFSGAQGTSPGNGFMQLPSPIDYDTKTYSAEGGYTAKRGFISANFSYSKFENDNPLLSWTNRFFGGLDTTRLVPDNTFWKLGVNGNLRQLPGDSTLAGRATYSKLTNDVPVLATMLSTGGTNPATRSNVSNYEGEVIKKTLSLSLSSHPVKNLDTRVYYNWSKEDNNSTHIVFSPAVNTGLLGGASPNCSNAGVAPVLPGPIPCTPELFGYRKWNAGIEAGYRINPQNKLTAGFDYYDMERERFDFHSNIDRKIYAEWKSTAIAELTGRLKYQYLERRSDWNVDPLNYNNAANPTEFYVRRFDLANVNQDLVKLVLDASPAPFIDLGLEAIYKKNDYKDTALGRTNDERQEYYVSVSFGDPKKFRMMVFADVEFLEYNSTHRVGGTTLANSDPNAAPSPAPPANSTIYTWNAKNKDKSWQIGLGADWVPMERLSVKTALLYGETQGTVDFSALGGAVIPIPGLVNIGNFDNTRRTSFNLSGTYKYTKEWDFTAGYAYERYRYSDIGYDNTRYVALSAVPVTPANSTSASYTTGQYSFQPYTANIVYVMGTYKF